MPAGKQKQQEEGDKRNNTKRQPRDNSRNDNELRRGREKTQHNRDVTEDDNKR